MLWQPIIRVDPRIITFIIAYIRIKSHLRRHVWKPRPLQLLYDIVELDLPAYTLALDTAASAGETTDAFFILKIGDAKTGSVSGLIGIARHAHYGLVRSQPFFFDITHI